MGIFIRAFLLGVALTAIGVGCAQFYFQMPFPLIMRVWAYPFMILFLSSGQLVTYFLIVGDNYQAVDFYRLTLPICVAINTLIGCLLLRYCSNPYALMRWLLLASNRVCMKYSIECATSSLGAIIALIVISYFYLTEALPWPFPQDRLFATWTHSILVVGLVGLLVTVIALRMGRHILRKKSRKKDPGAEREIRKKVGSEWH